MVAPNPSSGSGWERLRRGEKCPVCGHGSWCTLRADKSAAKCMRVQNQSPVKTGNRAGWIHQLAPGQAAHVRTFTPAPSPVRTSAEWLKLATRFRINGKGRDVSRLAGALGVSIDSLDRLRVGWVSSIELKQLETGCRSTGAWTFAMRNVSDQVVGVRLRTPDGFKYAVNGSHEGLFIPRGFGAVRVLHICEGPTSCAAMLTMGLDAIGRPSCTGGAQIVREVVRRLKPAVVIVWGDKDDAKPLPGGKVFYPGQDGAKAMAKALQGSGRVVRVFIPPVKDARDWLKAGATRETVERQIGLRRIA